MSSCEEIRAGLALQLAPGIGAEPLGIGHGAARVLLRTPRCRPASRSCRGKARRPPTIVAWPAIGVRHEPSSTARNARSAASAVAVSAWLIGASRSRVFASSRAGLDADRALPDRRQKFVELETRPSPRPRGRAASARRAPAASRRPRPRRACAAASRRCRAASTTFRSGRSRRSQRLPAQRRRCRPPRRAAAPAKRLRLAADERVARVLALAGTPPAPGPSGRTVGMSLAECTARSIAPSQQRLLDLLGEQALAAGLRQRPVLDAVAGGADHHELDPRPARSHAPRPAPSRTMPRLRQRQRAAARADPQVSAPEDCATGPRNGTRSRQLC